MTHSNPPNGAIITLLSGKSPKANQKHFWRYKIMATIRDIWTQLKKDYQEYVEIAYGWQVR